MVPWIPLQLGQQLPGWRAVAGAQESGRGSGWRTGVASGPIVTARFVWILQLLLQTVGPRCLVQAL